MSEANRKKSSVERESGMRMERREDRKDGKTDRWRKGRKERREENRGAIRKRRKCLKGNVRGRSRGERRLEKERRRNGRK